MNVTGNQHKTTKADPAPAQRARAFPPCLKNLKDVFLKFRLQNMHKVFVINMQCLQYVFYSLFSL